MIKVLITVIFIAALAGFFDFWESFALPEPKPEKVSQRVSEICGDGDKETCYYKEFTKIGRDKGYEYAFETLAALQKLDSDAQGCHLIAHGIGSGAYERDPENWQTLINSISPSCSYGAIHGVIERYLDSSTDRRLTKELITGICGPSPRADCNHIVGHLTLVETRANVDEALNLCAAFTDDRQREFCLTGVFMEYQTALNLIEHGYAPRDWLNWPARVPELEKMCREQSGENAVACWKEIVHAALVKFKNDPRKIFDFCNTSQSAEGAVECKFHSIGIMAAAKRFDLDALKPMCSIFQKEIDFKGQCYIRLVASMLSTLPGETDKAAAFCRRLDGEYRDRCFNQVSYFDWQSRDND